MATSQADVGQLALDPALLAGAQGTDELPGTVAPREVGTPAGTAGRKEKQSYGENNEQLPEELQKALKQLLEIADSDSPTARREEIKAAEQARDFWKGLQYKYYNSTDSRWQLPGDDDDSEGPRYMFVTNYYQAFGLSIMAVLSQQVPPTRLWPQDPDDPQDIAFAKAGRDIILLFERNNDMQLQMTDEAFYLWCDGKVGGYVRYVIDGSRFGFKVEDDLQPRQTKVGEDSYQCPDCGAETPASGFMGVCSQCGYELDDSNFHPAELVQVPVAAGVIETPNGAEVLTLVGGLELKTPPWCKTRTDFPYLVWDTEVHRARLKAAYKHIRKKIAGGLTSTGQGFTSGAETTLARTARLGVTSNSDQDGRADLVTYRRAWFRPWMFEMIEDDAQRQALLDLFPVGAFVAWCGDVYAESRNESLDDHWEVEHALPGDGQHRPGLGSSFISPQERINIQSNIETETSEYGIPATYVIDGVLDEDAYGHSTAEPAALYFCDPPADGILDHAFYQTQPALVSEAGIAMRQELQSTTGQFLTSAFPALFGADSGTDTVGGTAIQRDQALGRIGMVWRRMMVFHARIRLLAVETFRKNRPEDVKVPMWKNKQFRSTIIRQADLKGNLYAYPETDQQYPSTWSQKKAALERLMASPDPRIQALLGDPENLELMIQLSGLDDLRIPEEDARNKQLLEIEQLLQEPFDPGMMGDPNAAPGGSPTGGIPGDPGIPGAAAAGMGPQSSIPVDALLDNHAVELDVILRWASAEEGITARVENPEGFINVRLHAQAHMLAISAQQMQQAMAAQATGGDPAGEAQDGGGAQ